MNRLILLVESRIRGDVYVRFGGEYLKTHRRNTAGRRMLSLLQRQDILPSEEGEAFKRILDKGKDIRYISERFGKSETFIHGRLSLVRLVPEVTRLLDIEEITIGMAVEISKLESSIQNHLLKEHLETEVTGNNWKNLSFKIFKEKLEATYTVLLSRFSFDKSECVQCPYNSESYSLFPVPEIGRCTRSACLVKKHENHMFDSILAAIGEENLDVYLNNGAGIHAGIVTRLGELGIEVKSGTVYQIPEEPVMPVEEDFADNLAGFEQAQKDFHTKQTKWNALLELFENRLARKVVIIENLAPVFGYIMVTQPKESFVDHCNQVDLPDTADNSSNNPENRSFHPTDDSQATIKPDLVSTLEQKSRKNREEAHCNVIEEAKRLIKNVDIPPSEITPFENTLINFILLPYLDVRHYDFFGLPKDRKMTEEDRIGLFSALTDTQQNILRRDFLIHVMTQTSGVNKKSALLTELVSYHFPEEMAEIEHAQNEEYLKKNQLIQEQIDKLKSKTEDLQEVA